MIRTFDEGDGFRCAGNDFVMLLPRDETGSCEAVLQIVRPGATTPSNTHETFLQIYLIWSGSAKVFIGEQVRAVSAPAIAFVPPKTVHWVENLSATEELRYLYISVWPDGIPAAESEGGWRHVYGKIIDEYVGRGYAVNPEE